MRVVTYGLVDVAKEYLDAGNCVLPAMRTEKRPAIGQWSKYKRRRPTDAEISTWFERDHDAICILCGEVSGNGELLDFDEGGELFDAWAAKIPPELFAKLVIETTQRGGRHVYYRCQGPVSGNTKLAQRRSGNKTITLIETRGEGGLFLCAPTNGYEILQGDFCNPPVLSEEERETLLMAAWELNECPLVIVDGPGRSCDSSQTNAIQGKWAERPDGSADRPGDDFNRRGDVREILKQAGWKCVRGGENEHWCRPGKESGTSATLKDRVFYVFSTNAEPFESIKGYSPFAVYTLLTCGGDYDLAATMLRGLGFGSDLLPDSVSGVDISGIVSAEEEYADIGDDRPRLENPGPVPEEMLRIPGFIGEVMDLCLETAPYPNQVMAFCGALSLQAFLGGRKVRDSGDNRTNLYLLGLAHSSAGKDWPRKVNTRVLNEIGMANCLGERFASGEGIQDALFQTPSMLFQTDEIDGMLQSINKAKDARHEAIMSTLLTMYSSANSIYPMRRKAGKESPGVIDQPGLVIFGTAIPNHYYEALSERMLTNGFFARTIILESGPRGEGQDAGILVLPARVRATAKWWADYQPGQGNLQDWYPVPTVVEHSKDAKKLLTETRKAAEAEYAKAEANCDSVSTTVWGRVNEQVRKLALIYAVSENHQSPRIGLSAVDWASRFVMHQTRRMLYMASEHVADGDFDALIKRTITALRNWQEKHGSKALMPIWEMKRRLNQRPNDFKDVTHELLDRQIAEFCIEPTKTKPRSGYRLL